MSDIFTTEENKTPTTTSLEGLVGEGKKYVDVEALAKAYGEADGFINQLKTEGTGLREELDKRLSAEDVLSEVKSEREELAKTIASAAENTTPQLDEEVLSKLISKTVDQRDEQKVADTNIMQVDAKMKEVYGDKAKDVLATKAQELGLSIEYLAGVASKSPSAFFNVVGLSPDQSKVTTPSVTVGTTNTEAVEKVMAASTIQPGTMKYFEEIRKANPRKFFSPEIQNQLFKARTEKGHEGFYQ